MQNLQGLKIDNFTEKANIVCLKAEVDYTGYGTYIELENIKGFSINSNITNLINRTCSINFTLTVLNTNNRYSFLDSSKECYGYVRQGRRIKLYLGIRLNSTNYYWSWFYGIIDKPKLTYGPREDLCTITGRDYIAYLNEVNLKKIWWGKQTAIDIVSEEDTYAMPDDCKGIYRVFQDSTSPYNGTGFREIYLNSNFTYDWDTNDLIFLHPNIPDYNGTNCLRIYYFTTQIIENVVADILIETGILHILQRNTWLSNSDLVTPTGQTIDRVRLSYDIFAIKAINLLAEVAIYRFYINGEGNPVFKPIPSYGDVVKRINDNEYLLRHKEERFDELYNHIIIKGEKREMRRKWLSVRAYSSVKDLTSSSAIIRGAITDTGGYTVTKRGFEWQGEGEALQSWEESGTFGLGYFEHGITGLTPDKEHKFLAWALNSKGKKTSIWIYFKTEEAIS